MHLVGFIVRIYHDARSPECQTLSSFCSPVDIKKCYINCSFETSLACRKCVQMCPNVSKRVQTCPNVSKCAQMCPNVSKRVQMCPNVPKCVQTCPNVSKRVQTCPNVSKCGLSWQKFGCNNHKKTR